MRSCCSPLIKLICLKIQYSNELRLEWNRRLEMRDSLLKEGVALGNQPRLSFLLVVGVGGLRT